jgi:hypothetical protein
MSAQTEPERTELATLKLTRHGFGIELRRGRFEVLVDGHAAGGLDYGDTVELPVEPGHHTLRLRKGRYSSRDHSFDAANGEVVSFRCHGANLWPIWAVSFLAPNLGIALVRE